jgi:hypothetical protein
VLLWHAMKQRWRWLVLVRRRSQNHGHKRLCVEVRNDCDTLLWHLYFNPSPVCTPINHIWWLSLASSQNYLRSRKKNMYVNLLPKILRNEQSRKKLNPPQTNHVLLWAQVILIWSLVVDTTYINHWPQACIEGSLNPNMAQTEIIIK